MLTKTADLNFGTLEFDATHSGFLELGTDGNVAVVSGVGVAHQGDGNAGSVSVVGIPTDVIEIKCRDVTRLQNGSRRIVARDVELAIDSGVPYGSGGRCNGIRNNNAPVFVVDLATNPNPTILIGANLELRANRLLSGTYSSVGVRPVRLRVIFQ